MLKARRLISWLAAQVALGVILHFVFIQLPFKLIEHAVLGTIDDLIGQRFGISLPAVLSFIWNWGIPFLAAAAVLWIYHQYQKRQPVADRGQAGQDKPTQSPLDSVRISILELLELAKHQFSWDFNDPSLHLLDLLYGLRQAGSDSTIYFYGKLNRSQFEELNRGELIVPIDAAHWRDFELDVWKTINERDNFYVWTMNKRARNITQNGYTDVHALRSAVINWLGGEGDKFKGHNKLR